MSNHSSRRATGGLLAISLGVLMAACSGEQQRDVTGIAFTHDPGPGDDPLVGHFVVCKVGTAATFNVTVDGATRTVSLAAGACDTVARVFSSLPQQTAVVSVEEIVPANTELVSVSVRRCDGLVCGTTSGNNPTVARTLTNDNGFEVTFTNRFLAGNQGCTPGYWKQSQHFDSWTSPLSPSALFTAAGFTSPGSNARVKRGQTEFNVSTQLDALEANQGTRAALTRHAMAALLNAANPNVAYAYSAAQIVQMYNDALAGTLDGEATKNLFDQANNGAGGCPLN